jgi:hypothetical protein
MRVRRYPCVPFSKRGPFQVVFLHGETALIANAEEILYEAMPWRDPIFRCKGIPTPIFRLYHCHAAQDARCQRVYSRLEPHGA